MRIIIVLLFLWSSLMTHAQKHLIGKIIDEDSRPISGAKIFVKYLEGSFVLSDDEGFFKITATNQEQEIVITHLAYENKVVKVSLFEKDNVVVMVPVDRSIEEVEVVSTGYQTIAKERATGSFEQINAKDLSLRTSTNVLDKLEGQVPGLQYDNRTGKAKINVRGINTMSEVLLGPLIVVDNFPYEGNIEDINPDDVASVTILKDAAATSIWGARAGNGVIVINLKKPDATKPSINFLSNYTSVGKVRIKELSMISSADFIEVEKMLFDNRFYDASYNNLNTKTTIFSPVVEMLYANFNGALSTDDMEKQISDWKKVDYRDELQKYLYKNTVLQQYAISIANGNDYSGYRLSLAYNDSRGSKVKDASNTISINLQNEMRLIDKVDLSTRLTFVQSKSAYDANPMEYNFSPGGGKTRMYPYMQLKNSQGEHLDVPYQYNSKYIESLITSQLLDWRFIPLDEVGESMGNSRRQQMDMQLQINYRPTKWLRLNTVYNYQGQRGDSEFIQPKDAFYTRNLINRFTQINNGEINHIVPLGAINQLGNEKFNSHKWRGSLNIDKSFSESQHSIGAIIGGELSSVITNIANHTIYGYDPILMTGQQVDVVNFYPVFDGLSGNSRIPYVQGVNENTRRFVSFFTNASYTWKDRYITSFSARRDASNLFGVNTNDKWNPLWSAGVAWQLDKEQFIKGIGWVNGLRLRTTYGHSGNSGGVSTSLPTISYSSGASGSVTPFPRAMISSLPNPSLKWENVRMLNVALTFDLFAHRLSGSVEFFNKKSTDLLSVDNIDPTAGLNSVTRNVGVLQGSGWDIKLTSRQAVGNLKLVTTAFVSFVKDIVQEYRGSVSSANSYVTHTGRSLQPLPDKRLYPVFALRSAGLDPDNGDPRGWLDGEISKQYQKMYTDSLQRAIYYGSGLPPIYGSLKQSVSWKNIDFSFLISYKLGHYFQKETISYSSLFNSWAGHGDFSKRWQKLGDELTTNVPSMVYPAASARDQFYLNSEANIEKGDVIRLQDVNLNYTFKPFVRKLKATISMFASVNNVAILWSANSQGLDPDYIGVPPSRRYTLGINCKF
ncbi:SusC/RagA family TonB-linked outer membrane protein [Sphingobacterium sp. UT-1RO-CII-1]|uniref:SusC/RagA family TonB-linked outer membrane protein n=1 Tax=Sphingobacterium sp. UT-1RO-CII-1 TaxID=2995225 RepID=UPI00227A15D5|nr:SusC/RagA family TonB-linked outer membrane protein [Sphingobacterium sp. UT-1RO-CII-1]MCY4781540.1 SusC/RagA family TonB-linked outer membrane protein [Sphingobacterium sp. UT-1RO-CII-1]